MESSGERSPRSRHPATRASRGRLAGHDLCHSAGVQDENHASVERRTRAGKPRFPSVACIHRLNVSPLMANIETLGPR
jgi:hypothetical protein